SSFSRQAALADRYGCVGTGEVGCVESVKNTGITLILPLCWPLSVASFTLCAFVYIRQRAVMVDQVFVIAAYGINIVLGLLALVFLGLLLWVVVADRVDVPQPRHTVWRNFPVLGRFRYSLEHLVAFLRQYFFAMDREEVPFNRAERT